MSQCVPSWDLDGTPSPASFTLRAKSNSNANSLGPDVPTLDYEVAELRWKNGQLAMHGLGHPRVLQNKPTTANSSPTKYAWDKPRAGGTLESIVNQATRVPCRKSGTDGGAENLVPWINQQHPSEVAAASASVSITNTMDALVPCSNTIACRKGQEQSGHVMGIGMCVGGGSTSVSSYSGAPAPRNVGGVGEWSGSMAADQSVIGSPTFSRQVTLDTCEKGLGAPLSAASTYMGSPENTISDKRNSKAAVEDDHDDSVCYSQSHQRETGDEEDKKKATGKSSFPTKRSRAAAIHNQSERKRRDKINQKMKALQKLVPNSSKTDKASMLDEVIEYLKQLQAQVNMISRINMSAMMLPMAMQQQFQMPMMAPVGMGMGIGVMDMNSIARPNFSGIPPAVLNPTAFMSLAAWDGTGDRMPSATSVMPDLSSFLACQSQPMTMEAFSRMAALYHQLQQPPHSSSKN
uniref:Transcription factor bHLH27 n=1 Tax=Nothapodytes nimmoniana TaxID=159386 RepID=A0A9E9C2J3_NOTNI|nr:transcription factor bHLH27 [Nothapodytes nimmoniana]